MVGPLKKAPGGFTQLHVAIDKFTKWIEAKPITTINSKEADNFFLDIVYRFDAPNSIITDNRTTFIGHYFKVRGRIRDLDRLGIGRTPTHKWAS